MDLSKKEGILIFLTCALIAVLTLVDIIEDLDAGSQLIHVATEGFIVLLITAMGIFALSKSNKKQVLLKHNLEESFLENKNLEDKVKEISSGLSQIIESQLNKWNLTKAESEIAWLLIKGLSQKEIAEIRQTSEKTIRQQSATIYKKANVNSRSELSAFFIEDLLIPNI